MAAPIFIFALTSVIFFWRTIFLGLSLVPGRIIFFVDSLYFDQGPLPANSILSDIVFAYYPYLSFTLNSIHHLDFPLWNPYSMLGTPFIANYQSAVFEVTKWPLYFFNISPLHAPTISWTLTLFLAQIFTFLFCQSLGLSKSASVISALVFSFSGPFIVWLGYPLTSTALWLPFLLFTAEKLIAQPRSLKWLILFALGIGFQFFGGNPQISWFILLLTFVWVIFRISYMGVRSVENENGITNILAHLGIGFLIGFGIASIHVLPFYELLKNSEELNIGRGGVANISFWKALTNYDYLIGWSSLKIIKIFIEDLLVLFHPDFFGNPTSGLYWKSTSNYNESAIYIGIIPLFLVFIAVLFMISNKVVKFWTFSSLLSLGIALSLPFFRLVSFLPMFSLTNTGRLRFLFVFSQAILVGFGADYIFNHFDSKRKISLALTFYFVFILSLIFGSSVVWKLCFHSLTTRVMLVKEVFFLVIIFMLLSIILLFSEILTKWNAVSKLFLSLLIVGELFYYGYKYHPSISPNLVYHLKPPVEYLQKNIGDYRVTSFRKRFEGYNTALTPESSSLFGLQDIRGYKFLTSQRYAELFKDVEISGYLYYFNNYNAKFFNLLGIRYFVQDSRWPDNFDLEKNSLKAVYNYKNIKIYENNAALPKVFPVSSIKRAKKLKEASNIFWSNDFDPKIMAIVEDISDYHLYQNLTNDVKVSIFDYKPNHVSINVSTKNNTYLVITDSFYTGWKAFIDGKETKIYPTDIAFRGIFVPPGKHEIRMVYSPKSFKLGTIISIISILVVILLSALTFYYRYIHPPNGRCASPRGLHR